MSAVRDELQRVRPGAQIERNATVFDIMSTIPMKEQENQDMKPAAILAAAAICAAAASCSSAEVEPNPPAGKWTFYPSSASKLDGGALADRMTTVINSAQAHNKC